MAHTARFISARSGPDAMATGSLTYADGMLYCYGEDGTLGLVPATPMAFNPASRFKVSQGDGSHWSHPVIANGWLYIRHGDALIAYDISTSPTPSGD